MALSHPIFILLWVTNQSSPPPVPATTLSPAPAPHLEMEDAGIAILEALAMWNHSVQEGVIEGERGDGGQEPTVPWDGTPILDLLYESAPRGAHACPCWGEPRVPWVAYPSTYRNLGEPAPALTARACLGLQEGRVGAEPEGTGIGNSYGKYAQDPLGPTQSSLADVCAGGSIHDELGV